MLPPKRRSKSGRENDGRRCPAHVRFVRSHACSVKGCQQGPIEAAHVRRGTGGGMALKPSDRWTLSLCQAHHRLQHEAGEESFEQITGLDMRAMAEEFTRRSPHRRELEAMP